MPHPILLVVPLCRAVRFGEVLAAAQSRAILPLVLTAAARARAMLPFYFRCRVVAGVEVRQNTRPRFQQTYLVAARSEIELVNHVRYFAAAAGAPEDQRPD